MREKDVVRFSTRKVGAGQARKYANQKRDNRGRLAANTKLKDKFEIGDPVIIKKTGVHTEIASEKYEMYELKVYKDSGVEMLFPASALELNTEKK